MSLEGFHYSSLNRGSREIRLIAVLPRVIDEDVECLLTQHSLDEAPAYEALSYAWGNSTEVTSISINGYKVPVKTNVHSALIHLRRDNEIRSLWIDAICINQNNTTEKGHQVRLMKTIYECAKQVIIWLGEATRSSSLALEKVKEAASFRKEELTTKTLQWVRDEIFGIEAWMEFWNLLRREWWTRTWVVQEVTVAKQIILVCGDDHISVDCFDQTVINLLCIRLMSARRGEFVGAENFDDIFDDIRTIKTLKQDTYDILYLVNEFRSLQSSDPRDKLYALLGLAGDINFEPDYEAPVCEVYRRFVEACIERSRTLDVLNFVSGSDRGDIPSWIPDWTFPRFEALIKYKSWDHVRFFRASGDSVAEFQTLFSLTKTGHICKVSDGPASLFCSVSGFVTDTILRLGDPPIDQQSISSPQTPLMQQWISMFEAYTDKTGPYKTNEDHFDAFWMTLVADSNYDRRTSRNPELYRPFTARWLLSESWMQHPQFADNIEVPDFPTNFARAAVGRKFFISQKGYIGLAPTKTQPGDLICILLGGQTPFILRKYVDQPSQQQLQSIFGGGYLYELIGESYVHGLMDGEAYSKFEEGNDGDLETFVIM